MKKRLLFLGDIVGEPGLGYLETTLPELTHRLAPDFIIANAENLDLTTPERGGCGMRPESLGRLWALGVDVVTGGNHSFDPTWAEKILSHPRVLRPLNYSRHAPGKGALIVEKGGTRLGVVNLVGRSALPNAEDPLSAMEDQLERWGVGTDIVLVDFHSESVYEKLGFAFFFAGRVAAIFGTHTHVPTLDTRILPGGTAYVSDVGMVGSADGMQGYDPAFLVETLRRKLLPRDLKLTWAKGEVELGAVYIDLDEQKTIVVARC